MTDRMSNERIAELSEIQLYLDRDGDICRTGGGDNLVGCPAMSDDVMKGALNEAEWDAIPDAFAALRQVSADLAQANATIAERDAEIAAYKAVAAQLADNLDRVHYELPSGQDWHISRVLAAYAELTETEHD